MPGQPVFPHAGTVLLDFNTLIAVVIAVLIAAILLWVVVPRHPPV